MHVNPELCEPCTLSKVCRRPPLINGWSLIENTIPEIAIILTQPTEEYDLGKTNIPVPISLVSHFKRIKHRVRFYFLTSCISYADIVRAEKPTIASDTQIVYCNQYLQQAIANDNIKQIVSFSDKFNFLAGMKYQILRDFVQKTHSDYPDKPLFLFPEASRLQKDTMAEAISVVFDKQTLEPKEQMLTLREGIRKLKQIINSYLNGEIEYCVFDTETSSYHPWTGEIIMCSFTPENEDIGYWVPWQVTNKIHHEEFVGKVPMISYVPTKKDLLLFKKVLRKFLDTVPIVGHNLMFDIVFTHYYKLVDLKKIQIKADTFFQTFLMTQSSDHKLIDKSLKARVRRYFHLETDWEEQVKKYTGSFSRVKDRSYDNIPTGMLGPYAGLDAYYNNHLYKRIKEIYPERLKPVTQVLHDGLIMFSESESKGAKIDNSMREKLDSHYSKILVDVNRKVMKDHNIQKFREANMVELREANQKKRKPKTEEQMGVLAFKPTSKDHLREVLFGKEYYNSVRNPKYVTKKGGKPSTAKEAIEDLQNRTKDKKLKSLLDNMAIFTKMKTMKSNYIDSLTELYDIDSSVYHPHFNIAGTATGRTCLHGNTKVICLHGNDVRIADMPKDEEFYVYGCLPDGEIKVCLATSLGHTNSNYSMAKVVLSNSREILCTEDHRFMLPDGSYKEARLLESKDPLMSVHEQIYVDCVVFQDSDEVVQFYDIEVPETNNFALEVGVFVHNSSGFHLLPKKCLRGDTKISLLNGTEVPIKDLVGLDEFWVYSCKPDGTIVPGRGHSARVTGEFSELYRVTLDSGEFVECTNNHPFMLRDGSYKKAKDLQAEDSLMPLYIHRNSKKTKYMTLRLNTGGRKKVHRLVGEYFFDVPEGYVVHHKDHNSLNNYPDNLEVMKFCDHSSLHGKKPWEDETWVEKRKNQMKVTNSTPERKEWYANHGKDIWEDADEDKRKRMAWSPGSRVKAYAALAELRKDRDWVEKQRILQSNAYTDKRKGETSARLETCWEDPVYQKYMKKCQSISPGITVAKKCIAQERLLTEELYNKHRVRNTIKFKNLLLRTECSSVDELVKYIESYQNHKVVSVERFQVTTESVYDITVDDHHNFATTAGVFVHNSDIKRMYVSHYGEDGIIACCDYSQLELRVMAMLSGEQVWIDAYKEDKDLHQVSAAGIFNKKFEDITDNERSAGKCVTGDTLIETDKGPVRIDEIVGNIPLDEITPIDKEINIKTVDGYRPVDTVFRMVVTELVRVITGNGQELVCTPNHRFVTHLEGNTPTFKRADELSKHDSVYVLPFNELTSIHDVSPVVMNSPVVVYDLIEPVHRLFYTNGILTEDTYNFAIGYGSGPKAIGESLKIPTYKAKQQMEDFFKPLKRLKDWMTRQHNFVMDNGFVENLYGRRIYIPTAFSSFEGLRAGARRKSVNYPSQGLGSDIMTDCTTEMNKTLLQANDFKTFVIGTVHDSVELDIYLPEMLRVITKLPYFYEEYPLKYDWATCPLKLDISIGTSWGGVVDINIIKDSVNAARWGFTGKKNDVNSLLSRITRHYKLSILESSTYEVSEEEYNIDNVVVDREGLKLIATLNEL